MNKPVDIVDLRPGESATDILLCRKDVMRLLGISSTQFWRLRRYHGFPSGIRLSPGIGRWRLSDINSWIRQREQAAFG